MGFRSRLNTLFYEKPCRIYSQFIIGDKPADSIYRFMCSFQFLRIHHFWPNFKRPKRFSEMVWSRMLHERTPLLTIISDKLATRDYVALKGYSDYLIPLVWKGGDPENIPFNDLPERFVIKATHGCSYNIIVTDKNTINKTDIILQLKKWLNENYCYQYIMGIEWGYKNIQPSIIIEKYIGTCLEPPADYKFYCFKQKVEFCSIHFDRFTEHKTLSVDRNFKPHELHYHLKTTQFNYRGPKIMISL